MTLIASGILDTLALNAALAFTTNAPTRGGSCISISVQASILAMTAGDGPHALYLKKTDVSRAEFEAYIELNGPLSPEDTTASEVATRGARIRYIDMLLPCGNGTVSALSVKNMAMSGLRWSETSEGGGLNFALYNLGQSMSTGSSFNVTAQLFVRWNRSG